MAIQSFNERYFIRLFIKCQVLIKKILRYIKQGYTLITWKKWCNILVMGPTSYKLYIILVINDYTFTKKAYFYLLAYLINFFFPIVHFPIRRYAQNFLCPQPIIKIDFTQFYPHFLRFHNGCITLKTPYKSMLS